MDYDEFLASKKIEVRPSGFDIDPLDLNSMLFDFQKDIVKWALKKGKAAIFAGTGLGKTLVQLEWAKHIVNYAGGKILIVSPLAVAEQTKREGSKLGINVNVCKSDNDIKDGINITNYDRLHLFDAKKFVGVVLDESSILKSFEGKIRNNIIESFRYTPYKLACTATPAPNDHMELGNHAEFLGVMNRTEMLATYFVHDGGKTSQWRLKGHAVKPFWEWVASWAVMLTLPSDLGYKDNGFRLPPLNIHQVVVNRNGYRIKKSLSITERRDARRSSLDSRVKAAADLANNFDEPVIIWCDLNVESDMLASAIKNSVEVRGSQDSDIKASLLEKFGNGEVQKLISKAKIAGFGLNWQHCSKIVFVGISDSFESYYQAVRRCWRFGQKKPVDVYVITSEAEGAVVENIRRKEEDFSKMLSGMIAATQQITASNIRSTFREYDQYKPTLPMIIPQWLYTQTT